ncbi:MAG: hypothetical protein F6K54_36505 [Okeania sp. SIO3B5]|uniref:hypothetical protein n=1 Tax=Okeania sp. SIO3B5 TaxID=2607811 RepID=UPI0014001922|nr:hypothetical protein [Okeania sp. SIO3B5]NEO58078.1 hypothetical protein [Okeania sp. SIO3B5]
MVERVWGDGEMGGWGDGEMGRWGDWEIGSVGDWEIGSVGDWEIGGLGEIKKYISSTITMQDYQFQKKQNISCCRLTHRILGI